MSISCKFIIYLYWLPNHVFYSDFAYLYHLFLDPGSFGLPDQKKNLITFFNALDLYDLWTDRGNYGNSDYVMCHSS